MGLKPQREKPVPGLVSTAVVKAFTIIRGRTSSDNAKRRVTHTLCDPSGRFLKAIPFLMLVFLALPTLPASAAVWDCPGSAPIWYYDIEDHSGLVTELGNCTEDSCALGTNTGNVYACPSSVGTAPTCWEAGANEDETADNILAAIIEQGYWAAATNVSCVSDAGRVTCSGSTPLAEYNGLVSPYAWGGPEGYLGIVENPENEIIDGYTCSLHEDTPGETQYATNTVVVESATSTGITSVTFLPLWLFLGAAALVLKFV